MLSMTTAEKQILLSRSRRVFVRVYVGRSDGVTWVELTNLQGADRVKEGRITEDIDRRTRELTLTLKNDSTLPSLAPRVMNSPLNLTNGSYDPLLWPNREIEVKVAMTTGDPPTEGDFKPLFKGYLGTDIDTTSVPNEIRLTCNDLAKRLQRTYIDVTRTYGSTTGVAAETVMQQLIDDNLPIGHGITVYCPVSPGFMITPYNVEYKSVWDALQEIADQIGWDLRYRYISGAWRLAFTEPPRSKTTPDLDLTDLDGILAEDLNVNDTSIRNRITVVYRDGTTGARATVVAQDAASQNEFWLQPMQIEEGSTSLIDTAAEAQALADKVLHDLKDLSSTTKIEAPLLWPVEVFDLLRVTNPRVRSGAENYAIESYEHAFSADRFRTSITARGTVAGAHRRWLAMQTRPGSPGEPVGSLISQIVPSAPANLRRIANGIEQAGRDILAYEDLAWEFPSNAICDQYLLQHRLAGTTAWQTVVVPQGTASVPQRVRALLPLQNYEFRVAGISRAGITGSWSNVLTLTTATDTTVPGAPTNVTVQTGPGKVARLTWTPPADKDVNEYQIWRKVGNTPADPTGAVLIAEEAGNIHIDTTGDYSTTYTWFVKAVDASENVSAFSVGASAALPAPSATGPDTTPPASLDGATLTATTGTLYQDAQGNWFVRTTLTLSNVPADTKRAYIQIKHAASGANQYSLDDQIALASGSTTVTVDDLLPGVFYIFQAVPVSYFGVSGTPATGSQTMTSNVPVPGTVQNVQATAGPGKVVRVTWNAAAEVDVNEYQIWRKTGNTPSDPAGATLLAEEAGTEHVDVTGSYGSTYTYFVLAVRRTGRTSYFGTGAAATVPFTEPDPSVPSSLAGIGATFGTDATYQDYQGNTFVRVTINLSNIPADLKRQFIQVRHKQSSSTTYSNDDQLYAADISNGSATVTIDDLLPNVAYTFEFVPVTAFGVAGTAKSVSKTTSADSTPPATPTGLVLTPTIRGFSAVVNYNPEKDLAGYEWYVSTTSTRPASAARAGLANKVEFTDLVAGTQYWVWVRAYDTSYNFSGFASAGPVTAGQAGTGDIAPEAVSQGGAVFRMDFDSVTTSSTTFVEIPDMTLNITLTEAARVLVLYNCVVSPDAVGNTVEFEFEIDGSSCPGSGVSQTQFAQYKLLNVSTFYAIDLPAGTHVFKVKWFSKNGTVVWLYQRRHSILAMKR